MPRNPLGKKITGVARNARLFDRVRDELGVWISIRDRIMIADWLAYHLTFLEHTVASRPEIEVHDQSVMSLAKRLSQFVAELELQSRLKPGSPERKGYEVVVGAVSLLADVDYESGDTPTENHPAVKAEIERFRVLLGTLLHHVSCPVRGRPRVRSWKFFLFAALADVFRSCGGKVSASYRPSTGRIEGDFVRFMELLIDECPSKLQHHLRPGLADDVRTWLRLIDWKNQGGEEETSLRELTHKAFREQQLDAYKPRHARKGKKAAQRLRD